MSAAFRRSFDSLNIPNYRRYFAGQLVSLSGNWMQIVAEMWLILTLTGSALAVGTTAALQFLPMLLFAVWGGLLADRISKRRLLLVTQALMAIPALLLWGLTAGGVVEAWMVYALVFARGTVNAVDNPTRQSFVTEMVGSERVVNAVGLNSALIHAARIFGPAIAGVLIATLGVAACFLLNSLTFAAMIVALRAMDPRQLQPAPPAPRRRGALRATLRHVADTPALAVPLAMMAVVGTLGFNFQVILPVLRPVHLRRRRLHLHAARDRDGGRRPRRFPLHEHETERFGQLPRAFGARLRSPGRDRGGRPDAGVGGAPTRAAGRRERRLRRRRKRPPPALCRALDARAGDGALLHGLPRLDAHRRPRRRLAVRGCEPARRPPAHGDRRPGRGRRSAPLPEPLRLRPRASRPQAAVAVGAPGWPCRG